MKYVRLSVETLRYQSSFVKTTVSTSSSKRTPIRNFVSCYLELLNVPFRASICDLRQSRALRLRFLNFRSLILLPGEAIISAIRKIFSNTLIKDAQVICFDTFH
ncbi:hypothetical protein CEXT_187521 [Caerostris extrusa]|uniref:Uncharacterized protein n=1 Tax=Caerostris extrusa TaxID=172846 RepID=A0AAV4WV39_CAEEX|nr:hypothetical protein CEXT_187521 [Caerostris extrusa]